MSTFSDMYKEKQINKKEYLAVANHIVEQTNQYNEGKPYSERVLLTAKRISRLLYICQVRYMQDNSGITMFSDDFVAWPSGPVILGVYDVFVQYQRGPIEPVYYGDERDLALDTGMKKIIDEVLEKTIDIDTLDLCKICCVEGGPWHQVYDANDENHNSIISKESIYNFYADKDIIPSDKTKSLSLNNIK